jgi:catechol 2,3-dioxygenase-like lactoylglutathione lyase family enzyme
MSDRKLSRTNLSHVALRTPNVEAMTRFYVETMGLIPEPTEEDQPGARLGWGHGHHALELLDGPAGLDHFGLEIRDAGGHLAVVERLRVRGIEVQELDGATACVHDPDGNAVHLHGRVSRAGEHAADPGRRPVRIQHATLATAAIEPMIDFYLELGFRLTDRMGGVFAWLRSGVEHHSVAIVDVGRSGGLDHFSFDLDSWDDFKVWADRVSDLGVAVGWGPGRHGPGNNLFLFFDDSDGNHVELSAEMERFFDDRARYEPRIWDAEPTTVNLWGGQVPRWRSVA